jgi:hypothetical protein
VPILAAFADTPAGTVVVFGVAVAAIFWLRRAGPDGWKRLVRMPNTERTLKRTGAALRNTPVQTKPGSAQDEQRD